MRVTLLLVLMALLVSCSAPVSSRACAEWAAYHWYSAPPGPRLAGLTVIKKCAPGAIEGEGSLTYSPVELDLALPKVQSDFINIRSE